MTHDSKDPWHNIKIARPCKVSWQSMSGDEQVRHCSKCDKNVFNISNMTQEEAEALIREKDGDLCLRLYRRIDGTIVTRNCPLPGYLPWLIGLNAAGAAFVVLLFVTGQATQGAMVCPTNGSNQFIKMPVVYTCRDIEAGSIIKAEYLEVREVELAKAPVTSFTNISAVAGHTAGQKIRAGTFVLTYDVR